MKLATVICLFATSAFAECPAPPDHSQKIAQLLSAAREAPDENSARMLAQDMWALWADAPDETAQEMLDRGMKRRSSYDFLGALEDLDALVAYCPNYAEGYNQRAFVHFLRQDFASALPDLQRALELSPNHVAAMTGSALTLIGLGRESEAQDMLARAIELNPWVPERGLLKAPPRTIPQGEDL